MMKTPLDDAFAALSATGEDEAQSGYYGVFAASEIFVLLEAEPADEDQSFSPQMLEMDGTRYVLVFDTDARLAEFCDTPEPYLAMSGRKLVESLEGARLGVAVNPGFETAMFLPPEAADWIRDRTRDEVATENAKIEEILSPELADVGLLKAIDARLAVFAGFGRTAYLVKARYAAEAAHLMVFVGIPEAARASVAGGLAEALRFIAPDLALDTIFVDENASVVPAAARVGLRFDMAPEEVEKRGALAPGSDPDKPPLLH